MTEVGQPVLTSVADGIGRIRLNRPEALNAMNMDVAQGFLAAARQMVADPNVRVIVLEAVGRAFMAGGDLSYFQQAEDVGSAARAIIEVVHEAVVVLTGAPQITIAAVHGATAGGGMSLALNFDLIVASENAVFNTAYARIGTTLDCGGSWILPRIVGPRKAMEIALFCPNIGAEEALRLNLINRVVPAEQLTEVVDALARKVAGGAPLAQANMKRLITLAATNSLEQQLVCEVDSFVECAQTQDFTGAVAAFLEKRPYAFEGK